MCSEKYAAKWILKTSTELGKSIRCYFNSVEVISPCHYHVGVLVKLIADGDPSGLLSDLQVSYINNPNLSNLVSY